MMMTMMMMRDAPRWCAEARHDLNNASVLIFIVSRVYDF